MTKQRSILLIGSGRLATHLRNWVQLQSNPNIFYFWDRHQDPHLIKSYLNKCDTVWLAISDSSIVSFYNQYLSGYDHTVVHFSGALYDPRLISAHPLMSFSTRLYDLETYNQIHFALTGADQLADQQSAALSVALPGFSNPSFVISPELKPFYHALCVMAGNFPQMLWGEIEKQSTNHRIPFEAFKPYIKICTKNYLEEGPNSLTGPFVRKDQVTITKNIESLPAGLKNIYQAFQQVFQTEFLK